MSGLSMMEIVHICLLLQIVTEAQLYESVIVSVYSIIFFTNALIIRNLHFLDNPPD